MFLLQFRIFNLPSHGRRYITIFSLAFHRNDIDHFKYEKPGSRFRLTLSSRTVVPSAQASTNGERIPARGGHTCILADFQLVVFGGTFYKGNVRLCVIFKRMSNV